MAVWVEKALPPWLRKKWLISFPENEAPEVMLPGSIWTPRLEPDLISLELLRTTARQKLLHKSTSRFFSFGAV
jgi:hypothetical protein